MLTPKLTPFFSMPVRDRGDSYARSGRIHDLCVEPDYIAAEVRGTDNYDVWIDLDYSPRVLRLEADCTCPYVDQDRELCKHIWATLLAADEHIDGALNNIPARVMIELSEQESSEDDLRKAARQAISRFPPTPRRPALQPTPKKHKKPKVAPWARQIDECAPLHPRVQPASDGPPIGPLTYVIDVQRSRERYAVVLALMLAPADAPARSTARFKRVALRARDIQRLELAEDRAICGMLMGAARPGRIFVYDHDLSDHDSVGSALWVVTRPLVSTVLAMLNETDRLAWASDDKSEPQPLHVLDESWELALSISPARKQTECILHPAISRLDEPDQPRNASDGPSLIPLSETGFITEGSPGVVLLPHRQGLARVETHGALGVARAMAYRPPAVVQEEELPQLLEKLHAKQLVLPVKWPDSWQYAIAQSTPKGRITFRSSKPTSGYRAPHNAVAADISFEYGEATVAAGQPGRYIASKPSVPGERSTIVQRCAASERALLEVLPKHGVVTTPYARDRGACHVPEKRMARAAAELAAQGWTVLADGVAVRSAGEFKIEVTSGIDWFELRGEVDFGNGAIANAAQILGALERDERLIRLGDGSLGMLPDAWLERHGRWLRLGAPGQNGSADALRFSKAQVGIIDALLAEMPEATCDAQVRAARQRLASFEGIHKRKEPCGFKGELRPYQREGLGWLNYLADFGFGGILADDMGLGKTVQLLAHVQDVRNAGGKGPWLVVAPKSLMFNWAREAAKFAPDLKVLTYTGPERKLPAGRLDDFDLVLTTYNTMRLDIQKLRRQEFACVVLDEAQAIKNATSQSAKAARLLTARRRLALTGTPVENRLEDLWSIIEFLNPGMLGTAGAFRDVVGKGDSVDLSLIRRAVRPFILRRTKDRVALDLPARSEQTLTCELGPAQRSLYNALLKHYRDSLLGADGRLEREGLDKSRFHVLEALLRLRQAACHPSLIEAKPARPGRRKVRKQPASGRGAGEPSTDSAKIEVLLDLLQEILAEDHKALVFSQFTTMLGLVREQLDARKIAYEYLDGSTSAKEREAAVDRFQTSSESRIFLISLKAGGVGLNLTAADYVFLLDPWWNPAVEAQAIDRTHRIGQDKKVIAYRLIASGTVEERIQELQASKRELVQAIVGEDGAAGALSSLTRDELSRLLS